VIRDQARSYEALTDDDLLRLGRVADADLAVFFDRNPHLAEWRDRIAVVALAQGAAEHRLRGERGIKDIDVIVCFTKPPGSKKQQLRRPVVSWDWGPSRFGRCPFDPPTYSGRRVDMKYWLIPEAQDPVVAVRQWLHGRARVRRDPSRSPDLAHEPVILIRPELGRVIWDPDNAPPPKQSFEGHGKPRGLAPR
jgi:hypothetical protein